MLRRTKRSTFFLDEEVDDDQISHESNKTDSTNTVKDHITSSNSSNKNFLNPVGLRIVIDDHHQSSYQESNNLIIVKPIFRVGGSSTTSTQTNPRIVAASQECTNFLKACFLCKKKLNHLKDVYMYRGDQGFCSVDCRCRQILIDEIREMKASTKEILASSRHSPSNVWVAGVPSRRSDILAAA